MPPPINKPPMVKVSSSGTTGKVSPDFTSTLLSSSVVAYLDFFLANKHQYIAWSDQDC